MNAEPLLTIVVPTRGHPDYMEFYLQKSDYLEKFNILLAIHDSSPDDETKKVYEKYKNDHIQYFHYGDIDVDEKTILALKSVNTKYVFLCGDGHVLNASKYYEAFLECMKQDYDLIEFYGFEAKNEEAWFRKVSKDHGLANPIMYTDSVEHFKENCWYTNLYGSSIIKTDIFKKAEEKDYKPSYGLGFVYVFTLYSVLGGKPFKGIVYGGNDYRIPNPHKKISGWATTGSFFHTFVDNWENSIELFPGCYDEYKQTVKESIGKSTGWFTFRRLVYWKAIKNFNYKIYKQYKEKILSYGDIGRFGLWIVAITPRWMICLARFVLRPPYRLAKKIKGLFKRKG